MIHHDLSDSQVVEPEAIPIISATESDFARMLAEKSHEKRRQNKIRAAQAAMLPVEIQAIPSISATPQPIPQDSAQLKRARAQVDMMEGKLEAALKDAKTLPIDLDRLTRAAGSLREQVRILEGRPLPGARRPAPERVRREGPAGPMD